VFRKAICGSNSRPSVLLLAATSAGILSCKSSMSSSPDTSSTFLALGTDHRPIKSTPVDTLKAFLVHGSNPWFTLQELNYIYRFYGYLQINHIFPTLLWLYRQLLSNDVSQPLGMLCFCHKILFLNLYHYKILMLSLRSGRLSLYLE
jgi:hypothetical protein